MVAIARHLNVTLIVPELDKTSFWADPRSLSLNKIMALFFCYDGGLSFFSLLCTGSLLFDVAVSLLDVKVRLNNSFCPPIFQTHTHYNKIPNPTYLTHSVRAEYLVYI